MPEIEYLPQALHLPWIVNARTTKFDVYIGRGSSYKTVQHNQIDHGSDGLTQLLALAGAEGLWGNPHHLAHGAGLAERQRVLTLHKAYLWNQITSPMHTSPMYAGLFWKCTMALSDLALGCFCAPDPCHGDNIVAWFRARCPHLKE